MEPTDPPSQSEPDDERIDDLEHEVEGAREQVRRHDDLNQPNHAHDDPTFAQEGDVGAEYTDDAIAP